MLNLLVIFFGVCKYLFFNLSDVFTAVLLYGVRIGLSNMEMSLIDLNSL